MTDYETTGRCACERCCDMPNVHPLEQECACTQLDDCYHDWNWSKRCHTCGEICRCDV